MDFFALRIYLPPVLDVYNGLFIDCLGLMSVQKNHETPIWAHSFKNTHLKLRTSRLKVTTEVRGRYISLCLPLHVFHTIIHGTAIAETVVIKFQLRSDMSSAQHLMFLYI